MIYISKFDVIWNGVEKKICIYCDNFVYYRMIHWWKGNDDEWAKMESHAPTHIRSQSMNSVLLTWGRLRTNDIKYAYCSSRWHRWAIFNDFIGYFTAIQRSTPISTRTYVDKYRLNICANLTNLQANSPATCGNRWINKWKHMVLVTRSEHLISNHDRYLPHLVYFFFYR